MNIGSRGTAALRIRLAGLAVGLLLACGATQAHAIAVAPHSSASFTGPGVSFVPLLGSVTTVAPDTDVEYDLAYTFVPPTDDLTFGGATGVINWNALGAPPGTPEAFTVPDTLSGLISLHHTYPAGIYGVQADLTVTWIQAISSVITSVVPTQTQDVQASLGVFAFPLTPLPTPLPPAVLLFGTAIGGLGFVGWRRRSTASASAA